LFSEPEPAVPRALVSYVSKTLLKVAKIQLPERFRTVPGGSPGVYWYRCDRERDVWALMDGWGSRLQTTSERLMLQYFSARAPALRQRAEEAAEMGLDAATDAALRESLYVQLGVALVQSEGNRQRLASRHRLFAIEFSEWPWEDYVGHVHRLQDLLMVAATTEPPPRHDNDGISDRVTRDVQMLGGIADESARLTAILRMARNYADLLPRETVLLDELHDDIGLLHISSQCDVTENLRFWAAEPEFWCKGVAHLNSAGNGYIVRAVSLVTAAQRIPARERGVVANALLRPPVMVV